MISDLTDNITSYVNFLKSKYGLMISIHICPDEIYDYFTPFLWENFHNSPYCLYLKNNRNIRTKCINKKSRVTEKCKEGMYYGMCYCGVEEFFIPVEFEGETIGFISIGSFKSGDLAAMERIDRVTKEYNLDKQTVIDLYNSSFKENSYDIDFILLISTVIAKEIEFICMEHTKTKSPSAGLSDSESNSYFHTLIYLQTHYRYNIKLEEVCEIFGYSKSYISHIFRKRSGHTFNGYINSIRIGHAKKLLAQTDLAVNEIAEKVGFSSHYYFTNTFKKHCGMSPKEYRRDKK